MTTLQKWAQTGAAGVGAQRGRRGWAGMLLSRLRGPHPPSACTPELQDVASGEARYVSLCITCYPACECVVTQKYCLT